MSKKCRQCGSTSFSLEAGLKICDQCGVELKGYIELESQELFSEVDRSRFASKLFDEDDEAEVTVQDKELNNWTTYEAYNVVLYEWTQALCGLGASQHFKQVVYKLWVMYLHNLEIAFLKPASSNKRRASGSNGDAQPKVSLLQSPRDVQLINFGKESVCSSSMSIFSKRRKKKKVVVSELDKLKKKTERKKSLREFRSNKNSSKMSCTLSQELSKSLSEWESTSFISNSAAPSFNDEESVYSEKMDHPSDVSNAMSEDWQSFITGGGDTYNRHELDNSQTDEDEPRESRVEVCRNKFVRNWILQRTRMYESENEGEEENGSIFGEANQEMPFDCRSKESSFNASTSPKSSLKNESQVKRAQRIAQIKRARRKAQKINASQQRWFRTKQALHVSFRKLLGLVYLAVLIAKEEIFLLDIIRWCREGHIPYMSAQHLLKPDMKLFSSDLYMLKETQTLPTAEELQVITGNLILFLNIQSVPLPSVNDVIIRLVKILHLPESVGIMAQEIRGLEKTVYHNKQGFKFPAIESLAMASIIVVLKACYGVNDYTEVQLSRLAVKINEEIQPHATIPPLFSWEEWERYMCKVMWFCNQVDPVSAEYCQKFEQLVTMDASQFVRFFWSEGIWRYPKTLREEKKAVPFVQKILEWQGDSLEKEFSQSRIFKPTLDPFMSVIEQFLQQHSADDKHNIHNMVKVAEKLVETSFSLHTVDWTGKLGILQESLQKCNSDIIIVSEKDANQNQARKKKLGSKNSKSGRKNARGNTLIIPMPLERVWSLKECNKSNWQSIYDSCPSSFKWLVHLGSLVCETTDEHIFSGVIKLDRKRSRDVVDMED